MDGERTASQLSEALRGPGSVLNRSAVAWLNMREHLIDRMDIFTRNWLSRRRAEIDGARQSLEEMQGCREPTEVARVFQRWTSESLRQLSSDLDALVDMMLELPRAVVRQSSDIRKETETEELLRTLPATSGAKPRRRGRPRKN